MRTLARSFLVTVALGGCSNGTTTANPPPLEPTPDPAPVTVVVEDGPLTNAPTTDPAAPTTDPTAPTDPTGAPVTETTSEPVGKAFRGRIVQQGGGCAWVASPECDPGTRCNPPMPRPIVCPAVPAPQLDDVRERRRDGTCILYERPATPKCPPNVPCNPPAPRRVEVACPDA